MLRYTLLLLIFFVSGFCALTYQVAWTRILDHLFGVSVFATTTVLATFMAGLALGALLAGRRADASRNPLIDYAAIEAGIAVCAFLTPSAFVALEPLYGLVYRVMEGSPVLLTAARAILAATALLVPGTLMGATFPFMTRSLVRSGVTAGRDLGLLYGINTLGGVAGCLVTGFVLLMNLGTAQTIYFAGALNLVVAALACLAARLSTSIGSVGLGAKHGDDASTSQPLSRFATSTLILAIFASGFISLAYEIVWFRGMLSYVYNSTYAFSLMLAMFLLGIAGGGLIYGALPRRLRADLGFVGLLTVLAGLSFWTSTLVFPRLGALGFRILGLEAIDSWETGLTLIVVQSAMILLPPALLLGMIFPATLHLLTQASPAMSRKVGRLYSLNTLAGIVGSLVGGFVMIPVLGMRNSLATLIGAQFLIGITLIVAARQRLLAIGVTAVVALLAARLPRPPVDMFVTAMVDFPHLNRVIYSSEGITDSTAVVESIKTGDRVVVYSDGRGTAGTGWAGTQKFLGHVPMLLHSDPRRILNIGFGVGNSMSALIKHDPERIDCVELSSQVRLTAPYFWTNDGVLDDPRVRLIAEDGATYVRYTEERYDVITLEPPELHTAGVVNLYTKEFYAGARRILKPGGFIAQWFTAGQIAEHENKMLHRTLLEVFPYVVLFTELESTTYVAIGSTEPIRFDLDLLTRWWQQPKVAEHLRSINVPDPAAFLSYFVAGQDRLWEYVGRSGPIVTEDRTYVDFSIPRSGAAGFGFGLVKYPKNQEPRRQRTREEFAIIDSLRAVEPLSNWIDAGSSADPGLQSKVDTLRNQRKALRGGKALGG